MIAAWALLAGLSSALPVEVAHRGVAASDGARIGVVRYRLAAPGLDADRAGARAVLIVGELGFGRPLWDGFSRSLARRGWVVYLALLRGQGEAKVPGYRLRDWVGRDLPAVAAALEADGAPRFALIAHGFGGALALASASRELAGRVTRAVALSTPVEAQVPSQLAERLLERGGRFSSLGTDPGGASLFQLVLGGSARVPKDALARVRARGVADLGQAAAADLLEWMRKGDLDLGDGSTVASRLKAYRARTWLVLPLDDGFAASEMAAPLREVSSAPVTTRALNRAEFIGEDYDHVSMVLGGRAHADVWRPALAFLEGAR